MIRLCSWLAVASLAVLAQTRVGPAQIAGGLPAPNPIRVERAGDRLLTVGANCTATTPCVHRMRGLTLVFDRGWTMRLLGDQPGSVTLALNALGFLDYQVVGNAVFCSDGPAACYPAWKLPDVDHLMLAQWAIEPGGIFAPAGAVYTLPVAVYQPGAVETGLEYGTPAAKSACIPPGLRMDLGPARLFICIGNRWHVAVLADW